MESQCVCEGRSGAVLTPLFTLAPLVALPQDRITTARSLCHRRSEQSDGAPVLCTPAGCGGEWLREQGGHGDQGTSAGEVCRHNRRERRYSGRVWGRKAPSHHRRDAGKGTSVTASNLKRLTTQLWHLEPHARTHVGVSVARAY